MRKILNDFKLLFISFILIGCSFLATDYAGSKLTGGKEYLDSLVARVNPKWFRTIDRFSLKSRDGNAKKHLFYDVAPKLSQEKSSANIVILTPEGEENLFSLDIKSGQKYSYQKVCSTYDAWKEYPRTVSQANFSIGFLPRYLDQLNTPQKIIVFGQKEYFSAHHKTHYFDVKIVGAYIERVCLKGTCVDPDEWSSRLVLVAVKGSAQKEKKISSIKELSKVYDWEYAKAFIQNGQGKNKVGDKFFPAFKMGPLISAKKAIEYVKTKGSHFSIKKMKSLQRSCYGLYDLAWKDLSFKSISDLKADSLKDIALKKELTAKLKSQGKSYTQPFWRRFSRFFQKYHKDFKTCSRYVYGSNLNSSYKRHWFFVYLEGYFKLHELGYSYECQSKAWRQNIRMENGKLLYPIKDELKWCTNDSLAFGLNLIPQMFKGLFGRSSFSYKYISYDSLLHEKVHSWVEVSNKRNACFEEDMRFFPADVKWKK